MHVVLLSYSVLPHCQLNHTHFKIYPDLYLCMTLYAIDDLKLVSHMYCIKPCL